MKKLVAVLSLLLLPLGTSYAQGVLDLFEASLLEDVNTMTIFGLTGDDKGPPRLALVDSVIRVGRFEGTSILDIQAGFFGNANERQEENDVANWIVGGQLKLDPIIKKYANLNPKYEFLNAIEHGPVAYWDFTNDDFVAGYSVGLSFDLEDK